MKKLLITSALLSSLFLYSESAHATETNEDKSPSTQISQSELEKIGEEYDMQLDLTPSAEIANTDLRFKDIDEFKEYLKENKTQLDLPQEQDTKSIMENSTNNPLSLTATATATATTYKKYHKESWWSPINGYVIGVLSMKNIDFNYHYKKNKQKVWEVTKLTGIDSWQTGYHDVKWQHRNGDYELRGTKDVTVTVNGLYTLGVVVGNQPVGYSWNGKWEKYIQLTDF